MYEFINKIESYFMKRNIEIDDEELFRFGLKKLLANLLVVSIIVVITMFIHTTMPTLFFLMTLLFLRSKTGGFHFDNSFICFLFSVFLPIVAVVVFDSLYISKTVMMILCVLSSIFTIWFTPVDHPNKRLTTEDRNYFKKKILISFFVVYCILLICILFFSNYETEMYIELGVVVNFVSMVFALIKQCRNKSMKEDKTDEKTL